MDLGILPNTVALAALALLGYWVGRAGRRHAALDPNQMRRELRRAKVVVAELERIAQQVRRSLATHHTSVMQFKDRLAELGASPESSSTRDVCREAERLLQPTIQLATQMASAYDELRQQSNMLMSFTEVRTDPLTGLSNRKALGESLATFMALQKRYRTPLVVAIFDIDHFKKVNDEFGHLRGDEILKEVAAILESTVRETDVVARYGGEEFVVVMPETDLEGACVLARRICRRLEQQSEVTASGGLTASLKGDSQETLIARADEALYAAKGAGRNCLFRHNGEQVERVPSRQLAVVGDEEQLAEEILGSLLPPSAPQTGAGDEEQLAEEIAAAGAAG